MSFKKQVIVECARCECTSDYGVIHHTNTSAWMEAEREGWKNASPHDPVSRKAIHLCPGCSEAMKS